MLVAFAYMGTGPANESPSGDNSIAQYLLDFRRRVNMHFYSYMDAYVVGRPLHSVFLPIGWDFLIHEHDDRSVALEIFPTPR